MGSATTLAVAVIVRPGRDAGPALDSVRAAGVAEPTVAVLSAPGAWAAARNDALQRAAGADVLAFVDDDIQVETGWAEALTAAFARPALAVAAGPVRASKAPAWLAVGGHEQILGLVAPQAGSADLAAGNVAFRTEALRGVGGFFPVRGHPDARDVLGEVPRARDELVAVGWHAVHVDGMVAHRDLSDVRPGDLLRRRLQAGARQTALGGARREAGLALAARAAGAALARVARGDRPGALDRAGWAAQGVGAVLGPALAHGSLQPDRARTAHRRAVAAPAPHPLAPGRAVAGRVRGRRPPCGAILLYHRVVDATPESDPLSLAVAPRRFAEQMAALAAHWTPAPLEAVAAGTAGPHAVAVTFDDGYHDNLLHALPVLECHAIPATLFASTGHIAHGEGFWWDEVARLLAADGPDKDVLRVDLDGVPTAWAPRTAAQRAAVRAHLHAALQTRDRATITTTLMALRAWAGGDAAPGPPPARDRPLTIVELGILAAAGPFAVGAHGRTHVSLLDATQAVRARELRGSADDLEAWLGVRPTAFSYPFGVPGVDVDGGVRSAAQSAGYRHAVLNAPGVVERRTAALALPRLAVGDLDGAAFARWLAGVLPAR